MIGFLRELYETERELPNRNFAKGHSFDEWLLERKRRGVPSTSGISDAARAQAKPPRPTGAHRQKRRQAVAVLTIAAMLAVILRSPTHNAAAQTIRDLPAAKFILGPQPPTIGTSWFDQTQIVRGRVHGLAFPATPPLADLDPYILAHYYDLGLTEYIVFGRTGDVAFLDNARKVSDSWWQSPYIMNGTVRNFDVAGPAPRHAGLGGLMLRALDRRPEMWDWINAYTRYHFDLWLKRRINDPQLYYGVREGAFVFHAALWLAKVLPDSFPLQAGGTITNGSALREQYLADVEAIAVQYFARLQQPDGSWRWDDVDVRDADGGTLVGITQPFMVGLLLSALIDLHILTTNEAVKGSVQNQFLAGARHLYTSCYRKDEPVPIDPTKRWRSFSYLCHGGTTVNPNKFANGGWSPPGNSFSDVKSERQSISTIFPAFAYAYLLTRDPFFKTAGDELFDSAFGATDSIRNEADGTAKNYNQNYRRGASFLEWMRLAGAPPTPSPSPSPIHPEWEAARWPCSGHCDGLRVQKAKEGWSNCQIKDGWYYCTRLKR